MRFELPGTAPPPPNCCKYINKCVRFFFFFFLKWAIKQETCPNVIPLMFRRGSCLHEEDPHPNKRSEKFPVWTWFPSDPLPLNKLHTRFPWYKINLLARSNCETYGRLSCHHYFSFVLFSFCFSYKTEGYFFKVWKQEGWKIIFIPLDIANGKLFICWYTS